MDSVNNSFSPETQLDQIKKLGQQHNDPFKSSEDDEVEAAEKVINAMRYYQQYCMIKLRRRADAIRFFRYIIFSLLDKY